MKKIEKIGKLMMCISFLAIIFLIGIKTIISSRHDVWTMADQGNFGSESFNASSIDTLLKEHLYGKNLMISANGITQKIMSRRLVGNGQFYRGPDDVMHMHYNQKDYVKVIEDVKWLATELKNHSTPFLVCQVAERAAYGDSYSRMVDGEALDYIEPLKSAVQSEEALYLDLSTCLDEGGFTSEDIFFRTDIHYKTRTEFYILQRIIEFLEVQTELRFVDRDRVLMLDSYRVESYPFLGNLANYSVGEYYVGEDEFEYFLPKFDTSLHLENPVGMVVRSGDFESVCMNGYRGLPGQDNRVYRITDYMQWPSPYYRITNDLIQENDILVMGCSMSMRTMAYLSLMCKSVTVLDPRYFGNTDMLGEALESNYDAVIVFPSVNLLDSGLRGRSA